MDKMCELRVDQIHYWWIYLLQAEPELSEKEKKKMSIEETQKSLPIYPFKQDLLDAIEAHQVLIIEGETGSGKTTQLPQYLYHGVYNHLYYYQHFWGL